MKFSFLMAVNRDNPYLDEAIRSVCNQSDRDFLFYIVANNCTDELWEKICSYRDERIKAFRTSIGQLAFNLNYGLDKIKSGYVLRMDADDVSLPDRFAKTKAALAASSYPDIICGDAILIDGEGAEIGRVKVPHGHDAIIRKMRFSNPIVHPATAYRAETVIKLRGYCGGFVTEDGELWLRASRTPGVRFENMGVPVLMYRVHGDQARGNVLAYAETAGFSLREALLRKSLFFAIRTLISCMKYVRFSVGRR